jgi:hypothetical protein
MLQRLMQSTLSLGLVLASCAGTAAAADFRVWYYDADPNVPHQPGDISYGSGPALVKPEWACGLRINDPSYYRWVREFPFAQLPSADLYQDLHIWLPGKGCPYSAVTIEYRDGSQTFAYPGNRDYMEITGYYGNNWINAQGKIPACNCLPNFPYKVSSNAWHVVPNAFADLKRALREPRLHSQATAIAADLQLRIDALVVELGDRVALRQRFNLGDRETSQHGIEMQSMDLMNAVKYSFLGCTQAIHRLGVDGSYPECDAAGEEFDRVDKLIDMAHDGLQPQRGE